VYVRSLLEPGAVRQRIALCSAHFDMTVPAPKLDQTTTSLSACREVGAQAYLAIGYPVFGPRAIRADVAERTHRCLTAAAKRSPFEAPPNIAAWLGCPPGDLVGIVRAFGYRPAENGRFARKRRRRPHR
jgi:ATP-dependent RNA helicase SUPV3L1/SUV3